MWFRTRYPLMPHGPKRLEVRRNLTWSEVVILLDDAELGRTDGEGLARGFEHRFHDNTLLRVWTERGPRNSRFLYLTRNGHPLPGSEGDPAKIIRFTVGLIWICAAIQIAFSLLVVSNGNEDASIYWALGLGCLLALLGIPALRRSLAAMTAMCAIFFAEVAVFVFAQGKANLANIWSLFFALGILGWLLLRGIRAVRTIKATALPVRHPPEPPSCTSRNER